MAPFFLLPTHYILITFCIICNYAIFYDNTKHKNPIKIMQKKKKYFSKKNKVTFLFVYFKAC